MPRLPEPLENKTADFFIEVIRSFIFHDTNEEKYVNGVQMLMAADSSNLFYLENILFINVQTNILNT